jgi:hypothetical protein
VGRRRGLFFGVLAVLGVIVAGCGDSDGDQLATEEFFLEIGVLDKDYTAAIYDLEAEQEEAMEGAASAEEVVETFVIFTEDGVVVVEDFVNGIEQLNAPDDLVEFQDRAVSTGREAIDSLNDLVAALDDVATEAEQFALIESVYSETFGRLNDLRFEAQGRADDAGVDVTYDCGDE